MSRILTEKNAPGALGDYVAIARFDHWFKNVFMLPGVVLSLFDTPQALTGGHGPRSGSDSYCPDLLWGQARQNPDGFPRHSHITL